MGGKHLLLVIACASALPWGLPQPKEAVSLGRRAWFGRGGAWFGRGSGEAPKEEAGEGEAGGGEGGGSATMSEAQIADILAVVPVFCLADETGRPVLMKEPPKEGESEAQAEAALPKQVFFTDVDVARAHASRISQLAGDEAGDLKLAALDLQQVMSLETDDRDVSVMADPREQHVARQLLLKGAGYSDVNATLPEGADAAKVVDFADERSVAAAARGLAGLEGVDLERGVPLFSLKELNATIRGEANVQPWFLSFADLVRAYVNSTATDGADDATAAKGLEHLLNNGGITVATLDSVLASVRAPGGDARVAFILPPSSSLAVLRAQKEQADAADAEKKQRSPAAAPGDASQNQADALAAAANSIDGSGGGLFDE